MIPSLAALFAILCGCCGRNLSESWRPKWKVGDWWVSEARTIVSATDAPRDTSPGAIRKMKPGRVLFDVTGIESVNGVRCYAVQTRELPVPSGPPWGWSAFYFRCDNLRVMRRTESSLSARMDADIETTNEDFGTGNTGPFGTNMTALPIIPSFPLHLTGPEAESLKKLRGYRTTGYMTQTVTRARIEDFAKLLKTLDTIPVTAGNAYRVFLQQYWYRSRDSIPPTYAFDELWVPGLPWALYAEIRGQGEHPEIPSAQFWLADYSRWHRKGARPDTVGR